MRTLKTWISINASRPDWNLLLFLVLFLQVKLVIKLVAIVFIYIRQFAVSFRFAAKWPAVPFFYPAIMIIATVNLFIFSLYKLPGYPVLFLAGMFFWLLCLLAFNQISLFVRNSTAEKVHDTILVFFIINIIVSFAHIAMIMIELGEINPYRYQGLYQKYFINTGDYIKGITFDSSTANATLSSLGVFYFLSRKQFVMVLLCTVTLLLTFSNLINILVVAGLIYMFVWQTNRVQKSIIVVQLAIIFLFLTNVSPQNSEYAEEIFRKVFQKEKPQVVHAKQLSVLDTPDSLLNADEKKYKIAKLYLDSMNRVLNGTKPIAVKPEIPKEDIHAPESQHRPDSSQSRMQAIAMLQQVQKNIDSAKMTGHGKSKVPGKIIGFGQLLHFMETHPSKIITGNGMGNFSSKLAFRAAGVNSSGSYPVKFRYIHEDFKTNHLFVYLNYVAKDSGQHSVVNYPYSFFAQLPGEYGIAGLVCFIAGYLFYFMRHIRKFSYGIPVLVIVMVGLATEYWFEHLSVMVMFELLMLIGIKESLATKTASI